MNEGVASCRPQRYTTTLPLTIAEILFEQREIQKLAVLSGFVPTNGPAGQKIGKEGDREFGRRAGINAGPLPRSIKKTGRIWGNGFTPKVIWAIMKANARSCGLPSVAPHDLRRTCARLSPPGWRRTRSDSVPARACFNSDDGAIPRVLLHSHLGCKAPCPGFRRRPKETSRRS